jgi:hypothetical protein
MVRKLTGYWLRLLLCQRGWVEHDVSQLSIEDYETRMLSHSFCFDLVSISFLCLYPTSFMNSNLVFGSRFLHTLFGFCMQLEVMSSNNWTNGAILAWHTMALELTFVTDRYRQMPTFGRDTIRRFSANVSDMKKFAGRDFEDLLQVVTLPHWILIVLIPIIVPSAQSLPLKAFSHHPTTPSLLICFSYLQPGMPAPNFVYILKPHWITWTK